MFQFLPAYLVLVWAGRYTYISVYFLSCVLVQCTSLYNVTVGWILTEQECSYDHLNLGQGVSVFSCIFFI